MVVPPSFRNSTFPVFAVNRCRRERIVTGLVSPGAHFLCSRLGEISRFGLRLAFSDRGNGLGPPTFARCGGRRTHAVLFLSRVDRGSDGKGFPGEGFKGTRLPSPRRELGPSRPGPPDPRRSTAQLQDVGKQTPGDQFTESGDRSLVLQLSEGGILHELAGLVWSEFNCRRINPSR